jgi:hypothetical protein
MARFAIRAQNPQPITRGSRRGQRRSGGQWYVLQ